MKKSLGITSFSVTPMPDKTWRWEIKNENKTKHGTGNSFNEAYDEAFKTLCKMSNIS